MRELRPSDFTAHPWISVFSKAEAEFVALDIMKILKRTGDKFRQLSIEEYKKERLKDGCKCNGLEEYYFNKVIPYCKNAEIAKTFSKEWNMSHFYN